MKLRQKKAQSEAKKCFKKSENRNPNMDIDKDILVLSAIEKGIQHGYKMAYSKYYTPMCDNCKYRSATCFGPGAYCEECDMQMQEEEEINGPI